MGTSSVFGSSYRATKSTIALMFHHVNEQTTPHGIGIGIDNALCANCNGYKRYVLA